MPGMKDSGVEWVEEIPKEWKTNKIKYLFKTSKGLSITKENLVEEGLPVISYGQIHSKVNTGVNIEKELLRFVSYDYRKFALSKIEKFDFAFADTSEDYEGCGNCIYKRTDDELYGGYHVVILKSINKEDNRYFAYLFQTDAWRKQLRTKASGIKVFSVTQKIINEASIIIPPVEARTCISDFLDGKCSEIDALTADIQKEIDILEEYKKSIVFDVVCHGYDNSKKLQKTDSDVWTEIPDNWKLMDIKFIFEIVKRIAGKEGYDVLSVTQKGLKVKDITSGDGQLANSYAGYQFVYPTDYVMNHMDLLTGWVDLASMFGVTSPDYRVFRLRDKVNNNLDYYKYVMQCCYMNKIFYSLGQGVSTLGRWRLQTSSFNNFKVPVPPIEEQAAIADYLNTVINETNIIIEIKEKQLATLEEYKKSVIYEYVIGKKEVPLYES